jgi:ankyrin repeat protein
MLELLLRFGADPNQRGINDWTPLHMAVAERNAEAIPILLAAGADPTLATGIDDYETPVEMAKQAGRGDLAALLNAAGKPSH